MRKDMQGARDLPHRNTRLAASERRPLSGAEAYEILADALRPLSLFLDSVNDADEGEAWLALPTAATLATEAARMSDDLHRIGYDECPDGVRVVEALHVVALALYALPRLSGNLAPVVPDGPIDAETRLLSAVAMLVRTEYLGALDARDHARQGA